jgi:hypothetical protein
MIDTSGKPPDAVFVSEFWEPRHTAAKSATLRFARKYGVLLLREDRTLAFDFSLEGREMLIDWWMYSRKLCAYLSLAACLDQAQMGNQGDWAVIDPSVNAKFPKHVNPGIARYLPHGITAARQRFELNFHDLLHAARITFSLTSTSKPQFLWGAEIDYGRRLFSALVLQLLLTVIKSDSLYCCSGCGLPYARPRGRGWKKPKPGESNFCGNCGRKEALRQADRRRREKIAKAKSLNDGLPKRSPKL